jgi:RimJ/RimL family protein N-acetyltransferase
MIDRFDTERMRLRLLTLEDAALIVELDSDPEVMRYITGGRPTTLDEAEVVVRQEIGHRWIAFDRVTDEFLGWFGLRMTNPGVFELGYRLRRRAWGRGLATEGARTLVDYGFDVLGADRIWAGTMTVNARSRRVMEKCGLRHARTLHLDWPEYIDGSEEGDVEYELRREDRDGRTPGS